MREPDPDARINQVAFDEEFLVLSFQWLQEPEMAHLTQVPVFDFDAQRAWFDGLTARTDYAVWGIRYNDIPIGALGLKDIGVNDGAEYFFYIGLKEYWGRGVASWAYQVVSRETRDRGLRYLYGTIASYNTRSLSVHVGLGMQIAEVRDGTYWVVADLSE